MVREQDGRIRAAEQVQKNARQLRANATSAEQVLWQALRGRQLGSLKFRRQHPLGSYVADFCCPACRIVVELDGSIHNRQQENDVHRTQILESFGYQVLRFDNDRVLGETDRVLEEILCACKQRVAG